MTARIALPVGATSANRFGRKLSRITFIEGEPEITARGDILRAEYLRHIRMVASLLLRRRLVSSQREPLHEPSWRG